MKCDNERERLMVLVINHMAGALIARNRDRLRLSQKRAVGLVQRKDPRFIRSHLKPQGVPPPEN